MPKHHGETLRPIIRRCLIDAQRVRVCLSAKDQLPESLDELFEDVNSALLDIFDEMPAE